MEFIKPFWDEYGNSIIMLLAHGILIGLVIEFAVKKLFNSMIEKAEGTKKEKITRGKAIASAIAGAVLSFASTYIVVRNLPLPGGNAFFAFWCTLVFMVQYLTSLYGIKILKKKFFGEKKVKEPKPKKRSLSVNATDKIYKKLEDGTLVEV